MPYLSQNVLTKSPSHLINDLKDFMVSCGWTLVGPSSASEIAKQDDPYGLMLGWFLNSKGEDGKQDIHVHLGFNDDATGQNFSPATYLTSGISDTDTTIPVKYSGIFAAGQMIRIDNEIIVIGAISSNDLTYCARGWGQTVASSHSSGAVVQKLTNLYPHVEVYAARDLANPIAESSSGPISITHATQYSVLASVAGLGGYGNDGLGAAGQTNQGRFSCHTCLLKTVHNTNPALNGKYRWIWTYTDNTTDGTLNAQPFISDISVDGVEIYPGGFLPAWSRRRFFNGTYMKVQAGCIRNYALAAGTSVWFYGSKNAIVMVLENAGYNDQFYFGNVSSLSNPWSSALSASLAAGGSSVEVESSALFAPGQKVRILAVTGTDWVANKDRVIYSGAPLIDAEEMPSEEIVVSDVDYETDTVTFETGTLFAYGTGALIGEDPRPAVRPSSCNFDSNYGDQYYANGLYWPCYLPCDKAVLASHASHRQTFRAYHTSADRKIPHQGDSSYPAYDVREHSGRNALYTYAQTNNRNFQNNQLLLTPMFMGMFRDSVEASLDDYGIFVLVKGILHSVFGSMQAPPFGTALSRDTAQVVWDGQFRTFRTFYIGRTGQVWMFYGPEEI